MLETEQLSEERIRAIVREEVERALGKDAAARRACIIASKGTLDWAYPPLIVGTAAAAAGMEVHIFHTFYGLNIIRKDFEKRLKVAPTGNPAMPMPVPMPDVLTGMPGMKAVATSMMKGMFREKGVSTIAELLEVALELDVHLIACRMTMDVFGYTEEDFLEGVEFGGAAAFLSEARKSHVTLFV